jgi:hypothetical protein
MQEVVAPWYSDQILPFDVTITGASEYGAMCAAKIFGIEILNEGWGSSIDDTYQVSPSCRQPSPSRDRGDGEESGAVCRALPLADQTMIVFRVAVPGISALPVCLTEACTSVRHAGGLAV